MKPFEDVFPFERVLTLEPLIASWEAIAQDPKAPQRAMAAEVLQRVQALPTLRQPIEDPALLEAHADVIELLMGIVFPLARQEATYAAAFKPFAMESIYESRAFRALRMQDNLTFGHVAAGRGMDLAQMMRTKAMNAYHYILAHHYGVETSGEMSMVFTLMDTDTGLPRFFRVDIDPQFVTCVLRGPKPELTEEALQGLLQEPMNLERWMAALPPEHFAFHGFVIMNAVEVTRQEVLSALKDDLLQKDALVTPERIDHLQQRLRTLLRLPDLRLGLICLERSEFDAIIGARSIGRSLLLSEATMPECSRKAESAYAQAFHHTEPVIVDDLLHSSFNTGFEYHLSQQGLRNLMVLPLHFENKMVGLLELASPHQGALKKLHARPLMEVMSLFATAMKRTLEERENRIQALIKKKYTAIHPTVEWRFRQAAQRLLDTAPDGDPQGSEAITFDQVYPLYGLSDVRGSSTHRSAAIQADLVEQLGLALAVIIEATIVRPLPVLDEIGYRIDQHILALEQDLNAGDEAGVLEFLRHDVEPLFEELAPLGDGVRAKIDAYHKALEPALGILYRQRRDFDESITRITATISDYLDRQQEQAQAMFPHYFEKYKTDGVDYNIYIGAALMEDGHFNPLYLQNLRLWQLMTTCGVVWEMDRLMPALKMPLESTHLILAQHLPLAIRFRQDEKKFDVDGAYNVRYEIIKKRIDKAEIKGTDERLTQPRQIAIVYNHARIAQEYRRYIDYLQAAGYLLDVVEDVELKEMQGVSGLRALRVSVADAPPASEVHVLLGGLNVEDDTETSVSS